LCFWRSLADASSSARPAGSIDVPIAPVALTIVLREMSTITLAVGAAQLQERSGVPKYVNLGTMRRNLNFIRKALFAPVKNSRAAV
jgi:hypothetical protein